MNIGNDRRIASRNGLPSHLRAFHRALICAPWREKVQLSRTLRQIMKMWLLPWLALKKVSVLRQEDAITVTEGIGGTICHRHKWMGYP